MTIPDTENLFTTETAGLPQVSGPHVARLHDGDTFDLHIGAARKSLDERAAAVWREQHFLGHRRWWRYAGRKRD